MKCVVGLQFSLVSCASQSQELLLGCKHVISGGRGGSPGHVRVRTGTGDCWFIFTFSFFFSLCLDKNEPLAQQPFRLRGGRSTLLALTNVRIALEQWFGLGHMAA